MNVAVCLLVGLDAPTRAIARSAAGSVFSQVTIREFNTLEKALKSEATASGGELLVLANPDNDSIAKVIEATDATGLRRWALVFLGAATGVKGAETVSPQECNEQLLARAFRSAVTQHQLLRENERIQGDLRTLAYRITHDLRTPLGGILSGGEALKEILAERDPSSVPLTKSLFDSADELAKLIARVSSLLKASVNSTVKKPVAMGEIIWSVLQRHERQLLKQGAVVTQPDSWPEVEAVATWLEVVWVNLMNNALQHGKAAAQIELGWSQNEQGFRFWISDNGDGIPPEQIEDLFQPFHLLHRSNAKKGLGLSIVQRLLELQGGQCGYEPSSSGGSVFYFTLPAEKRASVLPSPPAIPEPSSRQARQA